jgi:hypothetical protein
VLRLICGVTYRPNLRNGILGFPWLNGGKIPTTILPPVLPPLRQCTGIHLQPFSPRTSANLAVDDLLKDRNSTINLLKEHLHKAQHCMKFQADKKCTERVFQVGD